MLITKTMGLKMTPFQIRILTTMALVSLSLMIYTSTLLKSAEVLSPVPSVAEGNWLIKTEQKQSLVLEKCKNNLNYDQLSELVAIAGNVNTANALLVMDMGLNSGDSVKIKLHSHICGWVAVMPHKNQSDQYSPLPNFPPDSVMLEAVGASFATVPNMARTYSSAVINGHTVRAYPVLFEFKDPDVYNITGILECKLLWIFADARPDVNYEWNFEKPELVSWNPIQLQIFLLQKSLLKNVSSLQVQVVGRQITIQDYQNLPFCDRGDHSGRWVKKELIEAPKTPARMGLDISPTDAFTSYVDEEDRHWLPYTCRYRPISYTSFKRCLAERHPMLHYYGDSNTRRSLKAITTAGAWCKTWYDPKTRECECTDMLPLNVPQYDPWKTTNFFESVAGSKDASIFFYGLHGLLLDGPDWRHDMEKTNLTTTLANFSAKTQKDAMKPSAVIVSLSMFLCVIFLIQIANWDAAFGTYEMIVNALPNLVNLLKTTYAGIPVIWRPGADIGGHRRRLSRLRVEAFNELIGKTLMTQVNATVWDIYALGEAQSPSLKSKLSQCESAHMNRVGVDLENQVFFNMLCPASS